MDVFQYVGSNDSMQISIHEIEHEVYIAIIFSSDHILQSDYILMARQFLQKDDLTKSPLCISCILESIKILLECDNLLRSLIDGLPDDAIGTLSQLLKNLVLLEHVRLNLFSHFENTNLRLTGSLFSFIKFIILF